MSGVGWTGPNAMADPDLQIRRGGGGGGARKKKIFFAARWSSVWSKNKGGGGVGHQGPSPGSATEMQLYGTVFLCLVCANSRE